MYDKGSDPSHPKANLRHGPGESHGSLLSLLIMSIDVLVQEPPESSPTVCNSRASVNAGLAIETQTQILHRYLAHASTRLNFWMEVMSVLYSLYMLSPLSMSEGVTALFRFPHFKLGSCHDVFRL